MSRFYPTDVSRFYPDDVDCPHRRVRFTSGGPPRCAGGFLSVAFGVCAFGVCEASATGSVFGAIGSAVGALVFARLVWAP